MARRGETEEGSSFRRHRTRGEHNSVRFRERGTSPPAIVRFFYFASKEIIRCSGNGNQAEQQGLFL